MASGERRARLHFGIYCDDPDLRPTFDLHTDTEVEYEIRLFMGPFPPIKGWVSGSWKCWGPADQATDGDESLHLVFDVTDIIRLISYSYPAMRFWLKHAIQNVKNGLGEGCRLVDHAIITSEDDSDVVAVLPIHPIPKMFSVDAVVF